MLDQAHLTSGVLSPFLPGTNIQYAWDSTSLGYLKTCPRLYYYIMIEGWSSGEESVHLRFGIEYHKALEDYDRRMAEGMDHESALHKTLWDTLIRTADFKPDETIRAGKYKNRRSLSMMIVDYLDKYKDDPAETLILEDGKPAVELSFRFELDWGPRYKENIKLVHNKEAKGYIEDGTVQPYILSGHLDRVVKFSGGVYDMDRKTSTTTLGDYYFNQFQPNNQMTLYTLASKIILQTPIKGVIIDGAQILVDSSRFVRGFTYRTAEQLEEWTADLRYWFASAERYAEDNYWPMNDTACDKFGGCQFRDICSKSPAVRQQFLKSNFVQLPKEERWNPLRAR